MAGVTISFDHRWAIDIGYRAQYLDEVSVDLTPSGQLSKATMGDHWEHQARIGLRANIWKKAGFGPPFSLSRIPVS